MEVTTTNYCRDTIQDSLVINPLPEPSFTTSNSCFFDSSYMMNTSTVSLGTIATNLWEYSDGNGDLTENATHLFADSGWYYITLTTTTDSGCFRSYDDSLYKHPRFDVSFTSNDTCLGFGNVFTNTTILEGGNFTDTSWHTSLLDTTGTYDYTNQFSTPGTYTIELVMEQDSFCRDTFTQDIEIHPLAVPDFYVSETCFGDSSLFTDASAISNGSYTIGWDWDDGLSGSGDLQKVLYPTGGIKTVKLTLTTDRNCVTDTIKYIPITSPEISALNLINGCMGTTQTISSTNVMGLDILCLHIPPVLQVL